MGNMPNKWIGRGIALALAAVSAGIAWLIGSWVGTRLAYGFTFDWYTHGVHLVYEPAEVLPHVFWGAVIASFLSVLANAGTTAWTTRWMMKRERYTPPRYTRPVGLDVHVGRLIVLCFAFGLVAILAAYVALATPLLDGGALLEAISPEGLVLLVAAANACVRSR